MPLLLASSWPGCLPALCYPCVRDLHYVLEAQPLLSLLTDRFVHIFDLIPRAYVPKNLLSDERAHKRPREIVLSGTDFVGANECKTPRTY
jgi:hypothetical protein